MTMRVCQVGAVMSVMTLAAVAHAQSEVRNDGTVVIRGVPMRPVEAGLADVGPLSTSQRLMRADLRAPTGFERVYQVEGAVGPFSNLRPSYFVRMDAGVTAVFPTSIYSESQRGLEAAIPPGTIFSIGGPIETLFGFRRGDRPRAVEGVTPVALLRAADRRAGARAGDPTTGQREARPGAAERPATDAPQRAETPENAPPTIWTSETVRQRRVGELLERARGGGGADTVAPAARR